MGRAGAYGGFALGVLMAKHKLSLMERLRAKKQPKTPQNLVLIWYDNEEEWGKVKATSTDPERFEDSYAEWVAVVEDSPLELCPSGRVPQKAHRLSRRTGRSVPSAQQTQRQQRPCQVSH